MNIAYYLLLLTVLTEATTEICIKSDILYKTRVYLTNKSKFLGELLSCGYCFSVWASIFWNILLLSTTDTFQSSGLVLFNTANYTSLHLLIIFILYVILGHRLSNYLHGLSDRVFSTRKDIRYKREEDYEH